MVASFFKYLVIGVAALIALKIALGILGFAFGLAIIAIPFAVIGFVVYKIFGSKPSKQISDADKKWLES
ncbi:MAG: hypothetical protein WEE89_01685 [Gemmatimonadota bacterium]